MQTFQNFQAGRRTTTVGVAMSLAEHGAGHCEVLYDSASKHTVTIGADSAMVLRDATTGDESNLVIDEHDYSAIKAVAISPDAADYTTQMVTGCAAGTVRVFSFPGLEYQSNLHRFDAPVRQLAYSADGKLIAAVAEDSSEVCLFDAATTQLKCKLKKHAHHVRSVAFDPSGKFLASSGGDGGMAIWDVSKTVTDALPCAWSSAKLLKDAKGTPEQHLHRLAWRTDGSAMAVPLGNGVSVLAPGKWNEKIRLRGGKDAHESDICVLAWSPSGRYLATGDVAGRLVVWDTESTRPIDSRTLNTGVPICSVMWDTKRNSLVASDRNGHVMSPWTGVVPADMPPPFAACMPSAAVEAEEPKSAALKKPVESMVDGEAGESGDEDDSLDDQLNQLSDEDDNDELPDAVQLQGGADRFAETLLGIEARAKEQKRLEKERGVDRMSLDHDRQMVAETPRQPAFCSGCTPFEDGRRQLGWSLVGRATCVERMDHSSVEIDFEDKARFRRPIQFIDPGRCTMGYVGETGAAFAAPQRGNTMSHLHFRFFDSWDREGWVCEMPDGEEIESLAFGRRYVAVATSLRNLRVFTIGGTPVMTIATDGAVVTLACSETDQLAVVCHAGRGLPTEQSMNVELWDLDNLQGLGTRPLPLSPGEVTLNWLGFASNGVLCSADSAGVVRAMVPDWNFRWSPIANLSTALNKGENEKLAVIGIILKPDIQKIVACPYKASRKHPVVLPKPMPKVNDLKLDILDSSGELADAIELLMRQKVLVRSEKLAQDHDDLHGVVRMRQVHDSSIAKMLVGLIKEDEGMKCLSLMDMANNKATMANIGAKAANAYNKRLILQRIQALQEELNNMPADDEQQTAIASPQQDGTRKQAGVSGRAGPDPTPSHASAEEKRAADIAAYKASLMNGDDEDEEEGQEEQEQDDGEEEDDDAVESLDADLEQEEELTAETRGSKRKTLANGRKKELSESEAEDDDDASDDDFDMLKKQLAPKASSSSSKGSLQIVDDDEEEEDEEEEAANDENESPPQKKMKASKKASGASKAKKSKKDKMKGANKNPFAATPGQALSGLRGFFKAGSA